MRLEFSTQLADEEAEVDLASVERSGGAHRTA
jgi:hypothetical protein